MSRQTGGNETTSTGLSSWEYAGGQDEVRFRREKVKSNV